MLRRFLQVSAFTIILAAGCFLSAGRFDWLRAWIYLALYSAGFTLTALIVHRANPEVLIQRGKLHRDTKTFDKIILAVYTPLALGTPAVAGLDAERFHWSSMPFAAVYAGAALLLLGIVPVAWAMIVNPFLETTVRIQAERGHQPVTQGPYRYVRHPMYVGVILGTLAVPLILGSVWAFAPAAGIILLFLLRTALEDRMLRRELPGYADYAQRTRYRLLPGVW